MPWTPIKSSESGFKEVQLIRSTSAILEWDKQRYLPKKAIRFRADQLSYLASKSQLLARLLRLFEYKGSAYDAVLDQFEPGATVSYTRPRFAELKSAPVDLVQAIGFIS